MAEGGGGVTSGGWLFARIMSGGNVEGLEGLYLFWV